MEEIEVRKILGNEIARHFLHHLNLEINKKAEYNSTLRQEIGLTAKESNIEIRKKLLFHFPNLEKEILPDFIFIKEWAIRNKFIYKYEEYSFDIYNAIFMERLIALQNPTKENIEKFNNKATESFRSFNYRQKGFSISFFLRVENNMREVLREMMLPFKEVYEQAWQIIFEQSKEYQENVNFVFEQRLEESIEESNRLLHNILPVSVANELKEKNSVEPKFFESATVLFSDFSGFTQISEGMNPKELILELDTCFSIFDEIIDEYKIEKIKTIGDSYMCASGIPNENFNSAIFMALASLKICNSFLVLKQKKENENKPFWNIRIGFHTGPLVAGVIGKKKFSYDIWGDTVNIASRMESSGELGKINISESSYKILSPYFLCSFRGNIKAKNKGEIPMYFLEKLKPEFSEDGILPTKEFLDKLNSFVF